MTDSDAIFEGFRDPNNVGIFFIRGKPFFKNGKIVFYRGCCCYNECQKRVWYIELAGIRPSSGWGPKPSDPPMREIYGQSHIMYYGESYDTYTNPGPSYWTLMWVIEYCWDDFDWDPRDNLSPDESYISELAAWSIEQQNAWMKDTSIADDGIGILDNPYSIDAYNNTVYPLMDLSGIFGGLPPPASQYWQRDDIYGPVLDSNCPRCILS